MRSDGPANPILRLAGAEALPRRDAAPRDDARTPHPRPAALRPGDPRWVFAVRAAGKLEGGTRAVLTPENRDRLRKDASALGLRPFDASLIIAIVQDAARAGLEPLGPDAAGKVSLVKDPAGEARSSTPADNTALVIASLAMVIAVLAVVAQVL